MGVSSLFVQGLLERQGYRKQQSQNMDQMMGLVNSHSPHPLKRPLFSALSQWHLQLRGMAHR